MRGTQHCIGCRNNFYNGNNDLGVKQCWSLKGAKLVSKLQIPIHLCPPYTHIKPKKVLNCYHKDGYVMVKPEAIGKDGYWKH